MERESLSKFGALFTILSSLALVFYYSQPLAPSGKTVVRFLTYETGPAQMALVREIERRFEAENPDIDVQPEFNSLARDKIYVEAASGTSPDTFYAVTDDIPKMAVKGTIEPLGPWIEKDASASLAPFFEEVVDALRYAPPYLHVPIKQQEIWAYPVHFSTDILFYNRDIFQRAGLAEPTDDWTWNDMVEAAKRLTRRDKNGRIVQFGMFLPDPPTTTIQSNGGAIFNADYTECIVNSPESVEALNELKRLRFDLKVAPNPAQVQGTSSMQMFKLGQIAMLPGRTYMAVDFNKITDFEYDVALMPGMKKNVERLAVGGLCMSKRISDKQKEAAWRWMKFYCSPGGGQELLGSEKNCVTAVEEYAWSPKYFMQAPPRNSRVFVTSLKDAVITTPPIVNASEFMNAISTPVFSDIMRNPDTDIPAMLQSFQDRTNALLAQEPKPE